MRENKILGVAIGATLLSMGSAGTVHAVVGSAQSGPELAVVYPFNGTGYSSVNATNSGTAATANPAINVDTANSGQVGTVASANAIAYELVSPSTGLANPLPNGGKFTTLFQFGDTYSPIQQDVVVKFSLTNSATWGNALGSDALEDILMDNTNAGSADPDVDIALIEGGQLEQNSAVFLVQASNANIITKKTLLRFSFDVTNVGSSLSGVGGSVGLEVGWGASYGSYGIETDSVTLVTAKKGTEIIFEKGDEEVKIDVAKGSTEFINSDYGDVTVSLGTVEMNVPATQAKIANLVDDYGIAAGGATSGTLTITNGIFGASSADDGVFIEISGSDCVFTDGDDIPATDLTPTEATWDLSEDDLTNMAGTAKKICVVASGDAAINDNTEAPEATLAVMYASGLTTYDNNKLALIKRNGTVCTFYNVPNPDAKDEAYFRFTNKSTKEGTLLGTLKNRNGDILFKDVTLQDALAVKATAVISATVLQQHAIDANSPALEEGRLWPGRAILTVSSDLPDMEGFGLLRGKDLANPGFTTGPLINVSTGATGNGCD